MEQEIVGHFQYRSGRTVIFFQPDDTRAGEQPGKVQYVADIGPAKSVDGLGLVPHGHNVARQGGSRFPVWLRPGQQTYYTGLHQVGILIFVHKDVAETLTQGCGGCWAVAQQGFQLKEQVVIVQQGFFPPVSRIGGVKLHKGLGVLHQMPGILPQDFFQRQLLVAGLAEQAHNALGFGEGAVAAPQLEIFLALLDCGIDVRAVHQGEGAVAQPAWPPATQRAVGKGMEGAPLYARKPLPQQQTGPVQHLLRGLACKGEQEDAFGRNPVFGQPGQTVHNGACLAAARARHHQHRAIAAGGGLQLGLVECLGIIYHGDYIAQGGAARQPGAWVTVFSSECRSHTPSMTKPLCWTVCNILLLACVLFLGLFGNMLF